MDSAKKESIVRKVVKGEMGLHQIDYHAEPNESVEIRRAAVEKLTGVDLESIGSSPMDYATIKGKNAENVIGTAKVPIGVVGPVVVNGAKGREEIFVPMATTEGALIASVSRGVKALNMSGGVTARVIKDSMSRGPVFAFKSILDIERFLEWLPKHYDNIKSKADGTTQHGKLQGITPYVMGDNVFLRFRYTTGDAMGMNMATVATEAACIHIEKSFRGARLVAVSGNMCSDKKQSLLNNIEGRGKTVITEATVKDKVLKEVFKTDAQSINEVNLRKNWAGSARAGSVAQFNAHFANVVAAIFLATGQDAAQVVESSSGYTWTEVRGKDLYISITLTSLEVGTVGGGTGLPTQGEALRLMKVKGSGNPQGSNAVKLAERIAAAVTAGELNLLAAFATRELGEAHQKLGRSRS